MGRTNAEPSSGSAQLSSGRPPRKGAPHVGHGSPFGEHAMSPMTNMVHQRRPQDHAPLIPKTFTLRDWFISPKLPKTFVSFNGRSETYRNWSSRAKDHIMSTNLNWGRVLEVIERKRQPLTKQRLAAMKGGGPGRPRHVEALSNCVGLPREPRAEGPGVRTAPSTHWRRGRQWF